MCDGRFRRPVSAAALSVVVVVTLRVGRRDRAGPLGVVAHAASGNDDPCGRGHAYRTWPRDGIRPQNPSTYSPPATLRSTSFVVLAAPRTASNSLVKALNADPRHTAWYEQGPTVQMHAEMFDPNAVWGGQRFAAAGWTVATRDANRTEFMRQLYELDDPPGVRGAQARGFKVFAHQLSEPELQLLTRPKHVLKIVLRRQDTLSQYVSKLRADEVGWWGAPELKSNATVAAFADLRVRVCAADYANWLAAEASWYDWMVDAAREHPESWLFISTERLTSDPYAMAAVYAHLQVPQGALLEYSPYTPDVLDDKVSNVADLHHLQPAVDNTW